VVIDVFRFLTGFTGLFDRAFDYTLHLTITHTRIYSYVFNAVVW
jgi:hypothetical protein